MEYCPQVCLNKVSGASAGAIAATALACQLPLGKCPGCCCTTESLDLSAGDSLWRPCAV